MAEFGEHLLLVLLIVLPIASVAGWAVAFARLVGGRPAVSFQPRRAVPWGLIDLAMVLVVLLALQLMMFPVLHQAFGVDLGRGLDELPAQQQVIVLTGAAVSSLAALLISLALIWLRTAANRHDLGIRWVKLAYDFRLGLISFAMLIVPVFGIQYILTQWMSMETKHPLVELVQENPQAGYFVCSAIAALVIAPVAEEYFFRVLLQGWLENVASALRCSSLGAGFPMRRSSQLLLGPHRGLGPQSCRHPGPSEIEVPADPPRPAESNGANGDPAQEVEDSEPVGAPAQGSMGTDGFPARVGPALWPTWSSSCLFALAHFNHGPDPIPLFFLALGLGYLYQRTHRVLPCVIVHFLVNAISMLQLWVVAGRDLP
jgi:membrane protease YdiL (CAAX protease family)